MALGKVFGVDPTAPRQVAGKSPVKLPVKQGSNRMAAGVQIASTVATGIGAWQDFSTEENYSFNLH